MDAEVQAIAGGLVLDGASGCAGAATAQTTWASGGTRGVRGRPEEPCQGLTGLHVPATLWERKPAFELNVESGKGFFK